MRREVRLSSLSPGRCFSKAPPVEQELGVAELSEKDLVTGRAVLAPEGVWKVIALEGDEVVAENARGEQHRFGAAELASEIPREGYERMAKRVREEKAAGGDDGGDGIVVKVVKG